MALPPNLTSIRFCFDPVGRPNETMRFDSFNVVLRVVVVTQTEHTRFPWLVVERWPRNGKLQGTETGWGNIRLRLNEAAFDGTSHVVLSDVAQIRTWPARRLRARFPIRRKCHCSPVTRLCVIVWHTWEPLAVSISTLPAEAYRQNSIVHADIEKFVGVAERC